MPLTTASYVNGLRVCFGWMVYLSMSLVRSFLSDRFHCGCQQRQIGYCLLYFLSTTGLSARPVALLVVCCASEWHHGVRLQEYADDIHIYVAIRPQGLMKYLSCLVNCTDNVFQWFLERGLLLNPTKTGVIVFVTTTRLKAIDTSECITAVGSNIKFSDVVKLSGVATGGLNPHMSRGLSVTFAQNRWDFCRGVPPSNWLHQIVGYDNFTVNFRPICKYLCEWTDCQVHWSVLKYFAQALQCFALIPILVHSP